MHLDVVSNLVIEPVLEYPSAERVRMIYEPWADWPSSLISHHGKSCCEIVRAWFSAFDYSSLNGGSIFTGPRWLRQRFDWGPTRYPIHWCEIAREKTLDCGVHAALAHEVFTGRGVRSLRTQIVQQFSASAVQQWEATWSSADARTDWIDGCLIYHEGCTILINAAELKLWDPSSAWWIDPDNHRGYGGIKAFRVFAPYDSKCLTWGDHLVPPNEWIIFR